MRISLSGSTTMTPHQWFSLAPATPSLPNWLSSLTQRIAAWATTCADYYEAAALYDGLSGLSDAELRRRGLSRATLAWDLTQACDRTNG